MELKPRSPFVTELNSFCRVMDKLWDRHADYTPFWERFAEGWSPSVDVFETENELIVQTELPGLEATDINVELSGDILTIKGEKKKEEEEKSEHHHHEEQSFDFFQRSFKIPVTMQTEKVEATFDKGILEVTFFKKEESKNKEIKINFK